MSTGHEDKRDIEAWLTEQTLMHFTGGASVKFLVRNIVNSV